MSDKAESKGYVQRIREGIRAAEKALSTPPAERDREYSNKNAQSQNPDVRKNKNKKGN